MRNWETGRKTDRQTGLSLKESTLIVAGDLSGKEIEVAHEAIVYVSEKFGTEISVSTFFLMVMVAENSKTFLLSSYLYISDKFDLFASFFPTKY